MYKSAKDSPRNAYVDVYVYVLYVTLYILENAYECK